MIDLPPQTGLSKIQKAVDEFAEIMKRRMGHKFFEGLTEWDNPELKRNFLQRMLQNANHANLYIDKNSLIDVANYAMMVWQINQKEQK